MIGIDAQKIPGREPEADLSVLMVTRQLFKEWVRGGCVEQLAILSFFGLAKMKFRVDLLEDPVEQIRAQLLG